MTTEKTKADEERVKREREEREKRERSAEPQPETTEEVVEETEVETTETDPPPADPPPPEKLSEEMTKQPWQTQPVEPVGHDLDAEGRVAKDNHTRRAGTLVPQGDSPAAQAMNEEIQSSNEARAAVRDAKANLSPTISRTRIPIWKPRKEGSVPSSPCDGTRLVSEQALERAVCFNAGA
jgi:hypothetical protein